MEVQVKGSGRPIATGLLPAFFAGPVVAAPQIAIGSTEVILGLLAICWIGFPLLLLVALVWQLVRSSIASLRRPLPVMRAPDTDLMT